MFTQRTAVLLGVLVVIGLGYVAYGTMVLGWFSQEEIQLAYRLEEPRRGRAPRPGAPTPVHAVMFGMNGRYALTSIRVEPILPPESEHPAQFQGVYVPPDPSPLWHLVAEKNSSRRIQYFDYGQRIPGLTPAVKGSRPKRLEPNTPYRLIVIAGRHRGELEFQTSAVP